MRKGISRGLVGMLIIAGLTLLISVPAIAFDKRVAENPLLHFPGYARPAVAADTACNVGNVHNRITNSTVEKQSGTNDWTILMGDDALELPSMRWQTPSNYAAVNDYLYFASFRVGIGQKLVHFSTDTSPGIEVKSSNADPTAVSQFDSYFMISDQSPLVGGGDKINVQAYCRSYAWSESYRDDFIIYDYWFKNLNDSALAPIYMALHADCDISVPEGGSGAQAYSRDDIPNYYRDDAAHEYISYMHDGDNPTVAGDDIGGNKIPKESQGYIGSRLLYCPPIIGGTVPGIQSGHGWWDWNSDPGSDPDWMRLMKDGLWLAPPPSVHDYRFLQKLGPFSIPAHDSVRIVFAFGIGEGLDGLRANLEWAYQLFLHSQDPAFGYQWLGPSAPPAPSFTAVVAGDRQVALEWNDNSESAADPATGEVDFEGYRLWRKTGASGNWTMLLESDIVNDIGLNTGIVHSYVDRSVVNGFQYFYAITAYDSGNPAEGIESFESGRSGAVNVEPGRAVMTEDAAKSGIHAVPNPFVLSSPVGFGFDPTNENPSQERVMFVNLPGNANGTVTIYSLTGDKVIEIPKLFNETVVSWDLITKSQQKVVAGVYLFVVESDADGFEDFIGKFMVVR
jgi:hypothetical protein